MAQKILQHGNMILDLSKQRMSRNGVEIKNMKNDHKDKNRFLLSYQEDRDNKIKKDENGKKMLKIRTIIDENYYKENPEDTKENIRSALTIARQYAQDVKLDLFYRNVPEDKTDYSFDHYIEDDLNYFINRNIIFNGINVPMLYLELQEIADNGLPVDIRTEKKVSDNTYKLPENLKVNIKLRDNDYLFFGKHCNYNITTYDKDGNESLNYSNITLDILESDQHKIFLGGLSNKTYTGLEHLIDNDFKSPKTHIEGNDTLLYLNNTLPNMDELEKFFRTNRKTSLLIEKNDNIVNYLKYYKEHKDIDVKEVLKRLDFIKEHNKINGPTTDLDEFNKTLFNYAETIKEDMNNTPDFEL